MANNTLLASDSFTSGSLAAGWGTIPVFAGNGMCQVVVGSPNTTEGKVVGNGYGQMWTGLTWPNDQVSEITVNFFTLSTNNSIYLFVRMQGGSDSGYMVNIFFNVSMQIQLSRRDSGANTVLASTTITVNSGDVFNFAAFGSGLHVYQNYARILYFADPTYPSGTPGYGQNAAVSLSNNRISSWRGYSGVQQDGVWTKQQVVIPALSGDLTSGNAGVYIPTQVLYEGNAQVLSGNVYKMWFGSNFGATSNILYAESTDGINWTRYGSPVIATQLGPAIFKSGSTYYMYTQSGTAFGTGNIQCYTSSNGISWALQNNNVIGLGAGGTWDSVQIFTFAPITQIGSTWYAAYGGTKFSAGPTTDQGSTGLATSSDLINWAKYSGNPVLSGWPSQAFYKVGGYWYTWVQQCQLGQGSAFAGLDPTEVVRYKSADLITWTNPVHSFHHSQFQEAVNANTGQCFVNSMINIGGKAYAYLNVDANDGATPQIYQIGLATAPTTIQGLVTQNEDAVSQVAADTFTRANGGLGSNWAIPTGGTGLQIASNLCEPAATTTHCGQYYVGTFNANQYSEITISNLASTNGFAYPIVRAQSGAVSWYEAPIQGPSDGTTAGTIAIYKMVSGVETALGPAGNIVYTPAVGDVFRLQVTTGSDGFPLLQLFQNGFLLATAQDYGNTFTTGNPGISQYGAAAVTDSKLSAWAGGNAAVIPSYSASGGNWNILWQAQHINVNENSGVY
jgi:hypothetical protein